jgi:outer membrane protein OmpA-like peptidoglycan-associated protein
MKLRKLAFAFAFTTLLLTTIGCRKKTAVVMTPPAPVAEAPADAAPEPQPVSEPAPVGATTEREAPTSAVPAPSFADELNRLLSDAYFDYDRHIIRADAREALSENRKRLAELFERFPSETAVIEGHADERGSAEYNLGLTDRRATAVKEFLSMLGLSPERFRNLSFGKERPQCLEENEDCWQKNRRVHFTNDKN